ncbi:hypothetical protein GXP67_12515 [Rhodocytophaga rosea]|uniref:Uncharacterized protein n=1 Tax=Rhodocytophaga rosea TaxID=2704465 RepID=A0A6C0GHG8_9BACT|nr:hypothetical protein [Rhodocytophaga rosea]QHT67397.1 hypothetical protein GXP67_12515 [Rhodocytophaga rosea]
MIGYDTIKAHIAGNHYDEIKLKINLQYINRERHYIFTYNKSDLIFSFAHGITSIRFSIPKLIHGDNFKVAGIEEAKQALVIISGLTGLDFSQFRITRLHLTTNIHTEYSTRKFAVHLKKPSYFKGEMHLQNGFYFHTNQDIRRSARVILFYKKKEEYIRIESKFENRHQTHNSVGASIRHFLRHEPLVSEIIKESFYLNCINYFIATLGTTIRGPVRSEKDRIFKQHFSERLQDSYSQSLHILHNTS